MSSEIIPRPVGRPRKADTNRPQIKLNGVVTSPVNIITEQTHDKLFDVMRNQNIIVSSDITAEAIISSPILFKQMMSVFKSSNCNNISVKFNESTIEFISHSTISASELVYLTIDCTKIASYYCKTPFSTMVDQSVVNSIIKRIKKQTITVTLISYETSKNVLLHCMFNNINSVITDNHYSILFSRNLVTDSTPLFEKLNSDIRQYSSPEYSAGYNVVFAATTEAIQPMNDSNFKTISIRTICNKSINIYCTMVDNSIEDRKLEQTKNYKEVETDLMGSKCHKVSQFEMLKHDITGQFTVDIIAMAFKPIISNVKDTILIYLSDKANSKVFIKVVSSAKNGNKGREEVALEETFRLLTATTPSPRM